MASDLDWIIEVLAKTHAKADFACGDDTLDQFLREHARQNAKKKLSTTYVAVRPGESEVLGYYSICSGQLASRLLPATVRSKLPRYPIPVIRLARLAVHEAVQGRGLGGILVMDALRRSFRLSEELGIHAMEVDAINPRARDFYVKLGFQPLEDDEKHLYMSLELLGGLV